MWLVWVCDSLWLNQREASQKIKYQLASDRHQENSGAETEAARSRSLCQLAGRLPYGAPARRGLGWLKRHCRLGAGESTPVAPGRAVMGRSATAASRTLVGDGRLRLPRPILTTSDHAGLCFLWLVLWGNFVDLVKATSFALFWDTSCGHSWLSHKKGCRLQSPLRPCLSVARWIL